MANKQFDTEENTSHEMIVSSHTSTNGTYGTDL